MVFKRLSRVDYATSRNNPVSSTVFPPKLGLYEARQLPPGNIKCDRLTYKNGWYHDSHSERIESSLRLPRTELKPRLVRVPVKPDTSGATALRRPSTIGETVQRDKRTYLLTVQLPEPTALLPAQTDT